MTTPIEVAVTVSNDEKKATHRFLVYEPLTLPHSPELEAMVQKAVLAFGSEIEHVTVKCKIQVQ